MRSKQETLILSVYWSEYKNDVNRDNHAAVKEALEFWNVPHVEALGAYLGSFEKCFLIPYSDGAYKIVVNLARMYAQECIGRYAQGTLAYEYMDDGRIQDMGRVEWVDRKTARKSLGFTCILAQNDGRPVLRRAHYMVA